MNVKLLTEQNLEFLRFMGGCTGSSESTHVKMPHCWKSHVTAHKRVKNSTCDKMDKGKSIRIIRSVLFIGQLQSV